MPGRFLPMFPEQMEAARRLAARRAARLRRRLPGPRIPAWKRRARRPAPRAGPVPPALPLASPLR